MALARGTVSAAASDRPRWRTLPSSTMYGVGRNEELVGRAIRGRRHEVVLATKFGNERAPDGRLLGINGRPAYVRAACEASLRRLGVEVIDLYYQHRVDHQCSESPREHPPPSTTTSPRHRRTGLLPNL